GSPRSSSRGRKEPDALVFDQDALSFETSSTSSARAVPAQTHAALSKAPKASRLPLIDAEGCFDERLARGFPDEQAVSGDLALVDGGDQIGQIVGRCFARPHGHARGIFLGKVRAAVQVRMEEDFHWVPRSPALLDRPLELQRVDLE